VRSDFDTDVVRQAKPCFCLSVHRPYSSSPCDVTSFTGGFTRRSATSYFSLLSDLCAEVASSVDLTKDGGPLERLAANATIDPLLDVLDKQTKLGHEGVDVP
jgi:hypothetical protein